MPTFGRYTLVRSIRAGGMAEVWKAKSVGPLGFEKSFAIKIILPELSAGREFVELFVDEARLVAQLAHPNIAQVMDFGLESGSYFIAMEYVPGQNLAVLASAARKAKAPLPLESALYAVLECCRGLSYAHAKNDSSGRHLGIVHRDISPHNVLVSWDGDVKLTDFGVAKAASTVHQTQTGVVRGKIAYMSPEQAAGLPVDHRSDLFSLGAMLYELVLSERIVSGPSDMEMLEKMTGFVLPEERIKSLAGGVQDVLRALLARDPDDRVGSASEIEERLSRLLGSSGALEGRRALAAATRRLFPEEWAKDSSGDAGAPVVSMSSHPPEATDSTLFPSGSQSANAPTDSGVLSTSGTHGAEHSQTAPSPPTSTRILPRKGTSGKQAVLGVLGLAATAGVGFLGFNALLGGDPTASPTSPAVSSPHSPTPLPSLSILSVAATATPRTQATAHPTRSAPATHVPTPRTTPTAVAAAPRDGDLLINARPWVAVFIDGHQLSTETPFERKIPSGKHTLRVENAVEAFAMDKVITVPEDGKIEFFVDVRAKTIEQKP